MADRVRRFLAMRRLRFAALDFIVTPDGDHVFLEANPNGQWAWIEDETGLPIAAAVADALEGTQHG
ncbi:D-alanine-D-alanine ligase-like ATP-grasp enzyme [Catenuloplanes nepalensis]|uniref:D-alanine-D-alanine ligase-like ATP-grasp enzyme n=1 Tax=Catenuloplanes nepalensis TaxID=587533 RepID=A0ABT9MTG4_9ACTN|nr:D-alanine-D-alanine ligase-like ATP-grasp enzyme [Catenuloplanes nepalensis]